MNENKRLSNNEFIYSPKSQNYAAGLLNNTLGVYKAFGFENVTSFALWTAKPSKNCDVCHLGIQTDGNLVLCMNDGTGIWASNTYNENVQTPLCLEILDSGNLIWTDRKDNILWHTNTIQESTSYFIV